MRFHPIQLSMLAAALLCSACNQPQPPQDKPSGLKNMAPPPIQETVQDNLDAEPNNTFLQATDITLTADGMQWSGTLTSDDVDVWHIKAKSGTVVNIRVTPDDDVDVFVDYSMTGKEDDRRFYDMGRAGDDEIIPNISLTPQGGYLTIRARVNDPQKTVRYRVAVSRINSQNPQAVVESEVNDSRDSAMQISIPGTIEGSLYPSGDVDFYKTRLSNPAFFSFNLPEGAFEVAVESKDAVLWSAVSKNAQILKSDMIMPGPQDIFVRIKSLEAIRELKTYSCSVEIIEKIPDEIEPNNTIDKAQTIQGEIQSLEFSLLDDIDIDIFKVILNPEDVYRIRITGTQPGQAHLQQLNRDGTLVNASADDQTICDAKLNDEALWLKVSSGTATWPLNYRISIDSEKAEFVEKEPNQAPDQATLLPLDTTIYGHIFPAGDVDIYRITLPSYPNAEGPIGTLTLNIDAGYVAPLQLKLQDSEGYEISQAKNEQYSKPIHLAFDAPNGTYLLAITGGGDSCLKPYALKATFTPNEAATASQNVPTAPILDAPQPNPDSAGDPAIDALLKAAQEHTETAPTPEKIDTLENTAPQVPDIDEDAF